MKKRWFVLLVIAWTTHATAWFLPTITSIHGGAISPTISGFYAFVFTGSALLHLDGSYDRWYWEVLGDISVISTVLLVLGSGWLVMRRFDRFRRISGWAALSAFVVNSHWYLLTGTEVGASHLGVGYFLWWFSFLLLAIALFDASQERGTARRAQNAAVAR